MLPDRYYVAEVREGPKARRLYFYANVEGLNGPEYGYTEDDSWISPAYEGVVHEIQERLSTLPRGFAAEPGAIITVSEPREIGPEELLHHDPGVNVYMASAIKMAKREIGEALHPIRVTWFWQACDVAGEDVAAYLKLSDDMGTFGEGFTLQELRNEALMKDRIGRLYRELLEFRSRSLVMKLLRMNVGAGKD